MPVSGFASCEPHCFENRLGHVTRVATYDESSVQFGESRLLIFRELLKLFVRITGTKEEKSTLKPLKLHDRTNRTGHQTSSFTQDGTKLSDAPPTCRHSAQLSKNYLTNLPVPSILAAAVPKWRNW